MNSAWCAISKLVQNFAVAWKLAELWNFVFIVTFSKNLATTNFRRQSQYFLQIANFIILYYLPIWFEK